LKQGIKKIFNQVVYYTRKFKIKKLHQAFIHNKYLTNQLKLAIKEFNTYEASLITDLDGKMTQVNTAFCQLTGYDESELIGEKINLLRSSQHGLNFYVDLWQQLNINHLWSGEIIINRNKNSGTVVCWLRISTVKDEQENPQYYLAHYTDLTAYKKTTVAFNRQLNIEEMISRIAILMLKTTVDNLTENLYQILEMLATELDADRAYIFDIVDDPRSGTDYVVNTHHWCSKGIVPLPANKLEKKTVNVDSWVMNLLFSRSIVKINHIDELPINAKAEKIELQQQLVKSRLLVPIIDGIKLVGYFGFDRVLEQKNWREEDIPLLTLIAHIFYLAQYRIKTEQLNKQHLEQSIYFLNEKKVLLDRNRQLMNKTLNILENERRFLAQELHDQLGQSMTAIRMDVTYLKMLCELQDWHTIKETCCSIDHASKQIIYDLRSTIRRIRTATIDHLGLIPALNELINEWLKHNRHTVIDANLSSVPDDLPESIVVTLYRSLQETLTNISKHAEASYVRIGLDTIQSHNITYVRLIIRDNGRGINMDNAKNKGFGILGMEERIYSLNGKLDILSDLPSPGTLIKIIIPIDDATKL